MIYGTGVDIVDIERFGRAWRRFGERFLRRLFTEDERVYCMEKRRPELHLAVRFAAKEALYKALSPELGKGALPFNKIEVRRGPTGRPFIEASLPEEGLSVSLSISHDGGYGIAQVIVEKALV